MEILRRFFDANYNRGPILGTLMSPNEWLSEVFVRGYNYSYNASATVLLNDEQRTTDTH